MFIVCTTGDTAHIDTIFKFLPHTRQYGCIDILHCCNDPFLRGHVAIVGRTQHVPPLLRDLADLKARIIAAVKQIDAPMLKRVWQELEHLIDVCLVTRGAYIEHL
jgi:hypothetical protein